MSLFSKQKLFCNICGKEIEEEYNQIIGRNCRVCSEECLDEFRWRDTLSMLGKEYRPRNKEE
jgi:hypothetical protein